MRPAGRRARRPRRRSPGSRSPTTSRSPIQTDPAHATSSTSWATPACSWPRPMPASSASPARSTRRPGWFLTDLFVDPAAQGHGIGRALLAEALPDDGPAADLQLVGSAGLPLYIRAGLAPWWPLLYLRPPGRGRDPDGRCRRRPGAGRSRPWSTPAAAELERELTGHDRSRDWAFWAAGPGRVPFRVVERGRPVAVGVVADARLGRLAIAGDGDPAAAVLAALTLRAGRPAGRAGDPGPASGGPGAPRARLADRGPRHVHGKRAGPARSDPPAARPEPGLRARPGRASRATRRRPPPASRSGRRSGCPTPSTSRRSCGPAGSRAARGGRTTSGSTARRSGSRRRRPCRA